MRNNDNQLSFVSIAGDFFNSLEDRNYSKRSIATYRNALNLFMDFIRDIKRLQDVTIDDVIKYQKSLVEKKLSINSVDIYMRSVKLFFRHLEAKGEIFINPVADIERAKPESRIRPTPTIEDMEKFIGAINLTSSMGIRNRAIIETAYSTGLRLSELLNLKLFDLDLANRNIRITGKGQKERITPLTKMAVFYLDKYLKDIRPNLTKDIDNNSVWLSLKGKKMNERSMQNMLFKVSRKAGFKQTLTIHTIRRACATHMLQNGANPMVIQELLGHSSNKSLSQYLKLSIADIKKMHSNSKVGN